jgi:hypothetical protein
MIKNKMLIFLLIVLAGLIFVNPVNALEWKAVNYSDPDLIKESGLTIDEFNSLSQNDWLELLGDKERVNFAFQAIDSTGKDITNTINLNLSINVEGTSNNELVRFAEINQEPEEEIKDNYEERIDNYALRFNGIGDYVNVSNPPILDAFTVSVWAKWEKGTGSFNDGLIQFNNDGNVDSGMDKVIGIWVSSLNGGLWGRIKDTNGRNDFDKDFLLESGQWYFISIRANGIDTAEILVNGVVVSTVSYNGNLLSYNNLRIGRQGTESWLGEESEIRVWDYYRSNDEIVNYMNKSLTGNEEGLVAYYDMEEGTGNTLIDKADNNDGIIYGADYVLKQ